MNLVEWLQRLMTNFGAEWVMWLLLGLSVISVAIMLERAWFYHSLRDDTEKLASELRERLRKSDIAGARKLLGDSPSAEAAVVMSGLDEADRGAKSASEAMVGARALQRVKLERRLAYLGTLGNNAPFVGLFGTVYGILHAFQSMKNAESAGISAVAGGISEALITTALGLIVAVPAVWLFNYFTGKVDSFVVEMDNSASELIDYFLKNRTRRLNS